MMRIRDVSLALSATLFGFVLMVGCGPAKDPLQEKAKSELLVREIQDAPISIEEAIAKVSENSENADPLPVVVKAKIGSGKGETFEKSSSAFLISEIPEGEHAGDPGHDADNCPFCRAREARAPTVMVRLIDKSGAPFPKGADSLLGLKKGQHVFVKGIGSYDPELNYFTIEADSLKIATP